MVIPILGPFLDKDYKRDLLNQESPLIKTLIPSLFMKVPIPNSFTNPACNPYRKPP